MHGRGIERGPAGTALRGIVAVLVAIADGGDGPPEVVGELGVPVGDDGVGYAHVEQRKQARIVGQRQLLLRRQLTGHLLPPRDEVQLAPGLDRCRLLRRPLGALGAAHVLGLVVVTSIERALEIGRWRRPHLVRALHDPRLGAGIFGEQRRRRGNPDAGRGDRPVGIGRRRTIRGAFGEDRRRALFTERNAVLLRGAVRNVLGRRLERLVDQRLLGRHLLQEDGARRSGGGGLG